MRHRRWSMLVGGALVAVGAMTLLGAPRPDAASADSSTSRFVAITPTRVVDSRLGLGVTTRLVEGQTTTIDLTDGQTVPERAVAVVVTVTVDAIDRAGWLQLAPAGSAVESATSTLNVTEAGEAVANTVFSALGPSGFVTLTSTFSGHVILDIAGYFEPAASSRAGRLVAVTPSRLLDTRAGFAGPTPTPPTAGGSGADPVTPSTTPTPATTLAIPTTTTVATTTTAVATTTTAPPTTTTVAPTTTAPPTTTTTVAPTTTAATTTTVVSSTTTTVPAGPPTKVMVIGDSIAAGNYGESPAWATFRVPLTQTLSASGCHVDFVGPFSGPDFAGPDNQHASISGITAHAVADDWIGSWAPAYRPDVVVIELGTNNALSADQNAAATTVDAIAEIVQVVRTQVPGAAVVIASPYQLTGNRTYANGRIDAMAAGLGNLAASLDGPATPTRMVDLRPFVGESDLADNTHPNETGAVKIAAALAPAMIGTNSISGCSAVTSSSASRLTSAAPRPAVIANGSSITVKAAGFAGIPTSGAAAAVVTVTMVDPRDDGWIQVGPAPLQVGATSSVNSRGGVTRANLVVVPLGADGSIEVHASVSSDVLLDVVGYFTDGSAAESSSGLFTPAVPRRLLDTRQTRATPLTTGDVAGIDLASLVTGARAVVGNVTLVDASAGSWAQLAPAPVTPGSTSTLNASFDGQTVAAGAMTALGSGSRIEAYVHGAGHVLFDLSGSFTA